MTMWIKYTLFVAIVAVSLKNVRALSKESLAGFKEDILPHITECSKEYALSEGDLKEAKEAENVDGINNCFFACVFKKAELMDDKGLFDPKKAIEKSSLHLTQEDDIKLTTEIINECAKVNSEDVTDGEAGCDRAKLLLACFAKNKDKLFGGE